MKLIMQNFCPNEFLPGCEYTVVDLDPDLMNVIERRGETFRKVRAGDDSIWQLRYWDWRPTCINSFESLDEAVPSDVAMAFDEWIEDSRGWVLLDGLVVPGSAVVTSDCQTMSITAEGKDIEVGWVFNLKDSPEVIRTAGVNLRELKTRIGDE